MRLLIYGDIGGSGGYVRYCKGILASNAIPKDMEVWFVSSKPFFRKLAPLDPQINVITHPWIDSKKRLYRYLWHLWVYPRIVRNINPNIEFYPSGKLRVYLRKALTIATCHNLLLFDSNELKRITDKKEQQYFENYRKSQTASFKRSDAVIFLSGHSENVVCNEVPGITQKTIISHGLDSVFLLRDKRTYEFGKTINLLYVSPVYHYKHQIEVVKAIGILRKSAGLNVCLKLIGGGDSSAALQLNQFVQSENAQEYVNIMGSIDYQVLLKEYISTDIFIFASSCETFGITILEAMGSRLPIACSDRTGLSEILKDAGVYFDPFDPKSIAAAVEKLIKDIELRKTLGEKAYLYSLDYTWERCALETFGYIKTLKKKNEK